MSRGAVMVLEGSGQGYAGPHPPAQYSTGIMPPCWGGARDHVCGHVLHNGKRIWREYSVLYLGVFVFLTNKYLPVCSKPGIDVFLVTQFSFLWYALSFR